MAHHKQYRDMTIRSDRIEVARVDKRKRDGRVKEQREELSRGSTRSRPRHEASPHPRLANYLHAAQTPQIATVRHEEYIDTINR